MNPCGGVCGLPIYALRWHALTGWLSHIGNATHDVSFWDLVAGAGCRVGLVNDGPSEA